MSGLKGFELIWEKTTFLQPIKVSGLVEDYKWKPGEKIIVSSDGSVEPVSLFEYEKAYSHGFVNGLMSGVLVTAVFTWIFYISLHV